MQLLAKTTPRKIIRSRFEISLPYWLIIRSSISCGRLLTKSWTTLWYFVCSIMHHKAAATSKALTSYRLWWGTHRIDDDAWAARIDATLTYGVESHHEASVSIGGKSWGTVAQLRNGRPLRQDGHLTALSYHRLSEGQPLPHLGLDKSYKAGLRRIVLRAKQEGKLVSRGNLTILCSTCARPTYRDDKQAMECSEATNKYHN
jgi:hypothetical protein